VHIQNTLVYFCNFFKNFEIHEKPVFYNNLLFLGVPVCIKKKNCRLRDSFLFYVK